MNSNFRGSVQNQGPFVYAEVPAAMLANAMGKGSHLFNGVTQRDSLQLAPGADGPAMVVNQFDSNPHL